MVVDVALWFISEYHTFKIKCDLRMVMRLVTMYVCVILGLFFTFLGFLPGINPIENPVQLWTWGLGVPLIVFGILNVRMHKKLKEQKKRKNLDT